MLTSKFLFSFAIYLCFFWRNFLNIQLLELIRLRRRQRTAKRGKANGRPKFWPILLRLCMVFGEGDFLSVIRKDFLHLCGCLVLHCFLEASSIYSSITQTKDLSRKQPRSTCICFLVSFIVLMKLLSIVLFTKKKSYV